MNQRILFLLISFLPVIHAGAQFFSGPSWDSINKLTWEDHQGMMRQLQIDSLRPGVSGMDPNAPDFANYDEAKANPYPVLPDPLALKNGEKVTSPDIWWEQRRQEIVEDFDR